MLSKTRGVSFTRNVRQTTTESKRFSLRVFHLLLSIGALHISRQGHGRFNKPTARVVSLSYAEKAGGEACEIVNDTPATRRMCIRFSRASRGRRKRVAWRATFFDVSVRFAWNSSSAFYLLSSPARASLSESRAIPRSRWCRCCPAVTKENFVIR